MTKQCVFTVRGTGEFPKDMLRYDECEPLTDGDRRIVEAEYGKDDELLFDGKHLRVLTVRLVTKQTALFRHGIIPTPKRWVSFLWNVVKVGST